ncbi:cation diffusion facilitator family transporter [Campylobacter geochelonis]|uniref:Pantothenate metabolism flavoprotein n=1 Tax=Campylobacter geochelonis TaxID=1780362 RepID=A0A128EJE0_9BACT|nr:cation diffusion facilitator family transporter [Campylobacter geochelonis]QKF71589.1 divalent metal cation transporter (ZT_dimer domain) [Campylobacter geochelonis]CZE48757.1 pantothenate metabolism flavoprotein [Campylobacter geochelonis]
MSSEQTIQNTKEQNAYEKNAQTNNKLTSPAPIAAGLTAAGLAIFKFIVGIASGSISVLASAIDSMLDCLISALNYFALKKSTASSNSHFNYGYGKIEALMALFEGTFIVGIGAYIFYESIRKIMSGNHTPDLDSAIVVMSVSFVATGLLILYLKREAARTNSLIIKADALHYKTDFFTNLGIIVALVIIKFSGFYIVDAIFGIIISGYIAVSAIGLIKEGVYVLLDGAIDAKIVKQITDFISKDPHICGYHDLRTRESAKTYYLSAHIVFNPQITLLQAHNAGDEIEDFIRKTFNKNNWVIDLHFDPTDDSACKV